MPEPRQIRDNTNLGFTFNTTTGSKSPTLPETYYFLDGSLISSGHYGYPNFPQGLDVGGPVDILQSVTRRSEVDVGTVYRGASNGTIGFTGRILSAYERLGYIAASSVDAYGPAAYRMMKPTKPSFSGLNALYELKDVPGMLRQRFHDQGLKGIGDYHLGIQFGWIPLLRDVINLVNTQRTAQTRLNQLIRDNGRPVRRRVTLAETTSNPVNTSGMAPGNCSPGFPSQYYSKNGLWTRTEYTQDRVWASSRFRYWLPGGPKDIKWRRRMLARIYGLNPSPSVIYNMIPWSWLLDWFTTAGDVIENLDAGVADRLAYDYFYVMRESKIVVQRTNESWFYRLKDVPCSFNTTSYSESSRKQRLRGDPFGWNTDPNNLTGMQLSILGALGLSRLR